MKLRLWIQSILAFIIGLGLLLLLHTRGRVLRPGWLIYLLWLVGPVLLIERLRKGRTLEDIRRGHFNPWIPSLILFGFMALSLFSSLALHKWFYFLDWFPRFEPMKTGMIRFLLLTSAFAPFLLDRRPKIWVFLFVVLSVCQFVSVYNLHIKTGGAPLFGDDHSSFMFRFWEFGQTFPQSVNYNPFWNGGVTEFNIITTGVGVLGIPLWPVWRFAPTPLIYTYVIGFVYIIVLPWIAVASLRILGAGWTAAASAGIMALGVSHHFFLWLLHYGTEGAVLAASLTLPVSACLFRALWGPKLNLKLAIILILSTFMIIQWPPGILMVFPMLLSLLLNFRQWTRKKVLFLLLCAGAVLILDLPQIMTILSRGQDLIYHLSAHPLLEAEKTSGGVWFQGWKHLIGHIQEGHPILIFLGLGGLWISRNRSVRRWYVPIVLGLALLTGWGPNWKPNLQLGRMGIPLFFIAIIPASLLVQRFLKNAHPSLALVRGALIALLAVGGWNVGRIYANKSFERYFTPSDQIKNLITWTKNNTPADGRILFAGYSMHRYGGGHIASLALFTQREMLACDYYHANPGADMDFPPVPFRSSEEMMSRYMELYNVTHIITWQDEWKKYFREHSDHYEKVLDLEDKTIFKVNRPSSLFLKGDGRIKATFNRLKVQTDRPQEDIILKYNWADELKVSKPIEIYPFDAGDGITLIGIHPNGMKEFEIVFRPRLFHINPKNDT